MNICIISPFPLYEPPYSNVGAFESWWKPLSQKYRIISISPSISHIKHPISYEGSNIIDIRIPCIFLPNIPYSIPNPLSLIRTIKKVDTNYDIDVFHIIKIMFIISFISSFYVKHMLKKPLIVSIHGSNQLFQSNIVGILGRFYKNTFAIFTLKLADKIITLDQSLINNYNIVNVNVETVRITPSHHKFIKYNKDEARSILGFPQDDFIVLFVGAFRKIKGIHNLYRIAKKLTSKFKNVEFIFLGDGPLMKKLELEKTPKIIFPGYVKKPEIYYAASDIFVLPSYSEGLSMAILEALASSKPVIVSKVGANPYFIKKDFGVLIDPDDLDLIEYSIIDLYYDKEKLYQMSIRAKEEFIIHFNEKDILSRIEKVYFSTMHNV